MNTYKKRLVEYSGRARRKANSKRCFLGRTYVTLRVWKVSALGDIFHPKRVDKASFTWSIIAATEDALKDEFGWQVGSGDCINIRIDNWRCWNIGRVHELYGQGLGDKICNLPIGGKGHCNKTVWFHNPHGFFNLKSAYSWLLLKEIGFGPHRFFQKALWNFDTIPKGCPRCRAEYKTVIHALKDCPTSRVILSIGG
ncbi:hypothetical protein Goklo_027901 [Gossypium klotzschianum]|uniref:Reverse transcriptase zinc-binding domain-containing protein n=1 Tax=Gossypium klotzschianum TaxID=34286 RepID=A0A7J8TZR2_9ROSI|nr:hypothetical protein [Gossypium klotzschianum]